MFDAFIGKFSKEHREDLSQLHGVLWEEDDHVNACRDCGKQFTVLLRKHHCRGCGGIYCENCTLNNVFLRPDTEEPVRACAGCRRGETPGEPIKVMIERILTRRKSGDVIYTPVRHLPLEQGSMYGDLDNASVRKGGKAAHREGYFEFVNKTDFFVCIKVILPGGDSFAESTRPSFTPVPPFEAVSCEFDGNLPLLEILLLFDNPNLPPCSGGVIYNTRAAHVLPQHISPCAKVDNFRQLSIYRVHCAHRNVVLKYKGVGNVEARRGTSLARNGIAGFFGALSISVSKENSPTLDFMTNCETPENIYCSTGS